MDTYNKYYDNDVHTMKSIQHKMNKHSLSANKGKTVVLMTKVQYYETIMLFINENHFTKLNQDHT
jgi:hypothetical protein